MIRIKRWIYLAKGLFIAAALPAIPGAILAKVMVYISNHFTNIRVVVIVIDFLAVIMPLVLISYSLITGIEVLRDKLDKTAQGCAVTVAFMLTIFSIAFIISYYYFKIHAI